MCCPRNHAYDRYLAWVNCWALELPRGVIDPARLTELYSLSVRAGAAVPRAGPGARNPATPLRRPWTPISPTGRGLDHAHRGRSEPLSELRPVLLPGAARVQ